KLNEDGHNKVERLGGPIIIDDVDVLSFQRNAAATGEVLCLSQSDRRAVYGRNGKALFGQPYAIPALAIGYGKSAPAPFYPVDLARQKSVGSFTEQIFRAIVSTVPLTHFWLIPLRSKLLSPAEQVLVKASGVTYQTPSSTRAAATASRNW